MTTRILSALAVSSAAMVAALIGCTPSTETEVAVTPATETAVAPPPPADIAAPTPETGPASANTSDTLSSTPASAPAPQSPPAAPAGASTAELETGRGVYARTCAMCHGPAGQGTQMGVALTTKDVAAIKEKVTKGMVKAGDKMPPLGASMTPADLDAVAKYVAAGMPQ